MKKIIIFLSLFIVSLICFNALLVCAQINIENPWIDCKDDFKCATRVSGITFPLKLSNYWIRAIKGMIEITYPLDEIREVALRKSATYIGIDISGVYTKYKKNEELTLENGVVVNIRGEKDKIYVMNMTAETGYYSAYCEQGMSKQEIEGIYEVIREAEEPKQAVEIVPNKYSSCELGDLVGKDVKRIEYHNYNLDFHSKEFKKQQIINFADECLSEGVSTQREMDCCLRMKMYPDEHLKFETK